MAAGRGTAVAMSARVGLLAVDDRWRVNLSLLVRLHWWAIVGQLGLIAMTRLLATNTFPVVTIGAIVAAEAVGNVLVERWTAQGRVALGHLVGVLVLDAIVLAVLIDLTGGAFNPFSTLFMVNIALAAALLPGTWAWVLSGVNLASYGGLFLHEWMTSPHHHINVGQTQDFMRLYGMWLAFCFAAAFIVYFIRRVSRALADRERELQLVRVRVDRRERLASLATLAAGAAHELGTPGRTPASPSPGSPSRRGRRAASTGSTTAPASPSRSRPARRARASSGRRARSETRCAGSSRTPSRRRLPRSACGSGWGPTKGRCAWR